MSWRCPLILALLAAGCAQRNHIPPGATVVVGPAQTVVASDWRAVASATDIAGIDALIPAWLEALKMSRAKSPRETKFEASLISPDTALTHPLPAPGRYRCRAVRLGQGAAPRGRAFVAQRTGFCFVGTDAAWLTFTTETGVRRPGGRLWLDGDRRLVFLGALAPLGGSTAPPYGADPSTDRAAVLERIGNFRWRLVFPSSARDAAIEIVELIPDVPAPPLYRASP